MLEDLKHAVLEANLELPRAGLVALTWGNVSGRDPATGLVVIKPSGVPYLTMKADDMVVVNPDGQVVEEIIARPPTRRRTWCCTSVSPVSVAWSTPTRHGRRPGRRRIGPSPVMGTTHADLSHMEIPVTVPLTPEEVQGDYEIATGHAVVAAVAGRPAAEVPAVLVSGHGTFCWGPGPEKAVEAAIALEAVAKMAWLTVALAPSIKPLGAHITERHFSRKHGPTAYYGQG